jgi:hypothetical protein
MIINKLSPFSGSQQSHGHLRYFLPFMQPASPSPCSQKHASGHFSQQVPSHPHNSSINQFFRNKTDIQLGKARFTAELTDITV